MSSISTPAVATQASLRSRNLALAATHVFAAHEPVARVDVANATGMTRSTASRLVDDLVSAGILQESVPIMSNRRGRPAVPLSPGSGTFFSLGLEVNVSHLAVRLVDLTGNVIAQLDVDGDYVSSSPKHVLSMLAELSAEALEELPEKAELTGVQVAVPGLVDVRRNVLLHAPNLDWHDVELFPLLLTNAPVLMQNATHGIMNEADCAAVLAAREAPGRHSEHTSFLYLSGEVGIGAALVRAGMPAHGPRGWAGEIGHTCIDPDGPQCRCGATGCLEQYAGSQALLRRAGAADMPELTRRLDANEPTATAALDEAGAALGLALANAANLLDVTTIILGGDLGQFGDHYIPQIMAALDRRLLMRPYVDPKVIATKPDHAAPALGAAYIALERVIADPARWMPEK